MGLTAVQARRLAATPQVLADRRPVGDLSLDGLRLRGKTISADIRGVLQDAVMERTIDGSSTVTLTLHDVERRLYRSGILAKGTQLTINGLRFVLVRPEKSGDSFSLVFEDATIWRLRQITKRRKATRTAKLTRAQFILAALRAELKPMPAVFIPELDRKLPVKATEGGGSAQPYEFTLGRAAQQETTAGAGETAASGEALPATPAADAAGIPAVGGDAEASGDAANPAEPGGGDDWWTGIQRLAEEIQWRAFVVGGVFYLASDAALMRHARRWIISEATRGVDSIDWSIDEGIAASTATVHAQAERWAAPPGSVVSVRNEGPASGLWIVQSIRRPLSSVQTEITLVRPREELPEPAAQTVQSAPVGVSLGADVPEAVQRCWQRAAEIAAKGQPYAWGGGHGSLNSPGPFDCSGFVSNVLGAGGLISSTMSTAGLISWGEAGMGQFMTVWVKETGVARESHTFIQWHFGPYWGSEAGGQRGVLTGWRSGRSTAGFQPRHYPSL